MAEESLDLAATLRLTGRRVHNQNADESGNALQLARAIDLSVIDVLCPVRMCGESWCFAPRSAMAVEDSPHNL
jgi:hypothetical protein